MKRKSLILIMVLLLLLLCTPTSLAAKNHALAISDYQFTNESDPISMPSYLIDGEVYVPLRIFADTFNVTVNYDANTKRINMDYGTTKDAQTQLQGLHNM